MGVGSDLEYDIIDNIVSMRGANGNKGIENRLV
jgi:hypothetical protein